MPSYVKRPKKDPVFYHPGVPEHKMQYTFSMCQLICHPNKDVRNHRYKLLRTSEVIVEDESGNRKRVSPNEAEKIIAKMPKEKQKLYIE